VTQEPELTETPQPTEALEPTEAPQPTEALESTEAPQPTEALGPTEATEEAEVVEPKERPTVYWGLGRRKTAVARVRLMRGSGRIIVNGTDADEYFTDERQIQAVRAPLKELRLSGRYDVLVNACGGGIGGQSGAVLLGIARALVKAEPDCEEKLRGLRMLTRDPRMKERKKYGKRSARASFQFSKR